MKTRFVFPAAVAMAVHAFLLLGFRTDRQSTDDPTRRPIVRNVPPDKPIEIEWTAAADEPTEETPHGVPGEARPDLPEPPAPDPITTTVMSPSIPHPTPISPTHLTRIEPYGDPDSKSVNPVPGDHGPMRFTMLDNPPRTRSQIAPVYPYEAKVAGRPGEVMVEFVVDESGRVVDPHVVSSNDPAFEAPTLRAIAKWRFEPGRKAGRIVRFRMAVPVAFSVNP